MSSRVASLQYFISMIVRSASLSLANARCTISINRVRHRGWRAESYGKILHAGLVEGEIEYGMLDVGRSWDYAKMFQPTEVGRTGDVRNLTGGKLPWCRVVNA